MNEPELRNRIGRSLVGDEGVQTTDIHSAVADDAVLQTLLESIDVLMRSEDRKNDTGNSRPLLDCKPR